jgi:ubiquinone/menaquinone biosynthesis C-methylase UbiE
LSSIIPYDEAWTWRVETLDTTFDMLAQRHAVFDALAAQPGERVADLGAGPGMLAAELGRVVGSAGQVKCIDISQPMVDLAGRRCAGLP